MYYCSGGTTIRSELGLSAGRNPELLDEIGTETAEEASAFLIWP